MAFIKIENVVINTAYIAAIRIEEQAGCEVHNVSLLIAVPTASSLQETASQGLYHYEWLEFTGDAAIALRDYFSSFNNVIDLLPQYKCPALYGNSQWHRGD